MGRRADGLHAWAGLLNRPAFLVKGKPPEDGSEGFEVETELSPEG
jgi:hypothetical protein